jgi:hypothetical protein
VLGGGAGGGLTDAICEPGAAAGELAGGKLASYARWTAAGSSDSDAAVLGGGLADAVCEPGAAGELGGGLLGGVCVATVWV